MDFTNLFIMTVSWFYSLISLLCFSKEKERDFPETGERSMKSDSTWGIASWRFTHCPEQSNRRWKQNDSLMPKLWLEDLLVSFVLYTKALWEMAVADGDMKIRILDFNFPYFGNMINNLFINRAIFVGNINELLLFWSLWLIVSQQWARWSVWKRSSGSSEAYCEY